MGSSISGSVQRFNQRPKTRQEWVECAKELKENWDDLLCIECEEFVPKFLPPHVRNAHDMTTSQYKEKYPGAPVLSDSFCKNTGHHGYQDHKDPVDPEGLFLLEDDDALVTCRICGYQSTQLRPHIASHGWDIEDYQEEFPGAPLNSDAFGESISQGLIIDFGMYDWNRLHVPRPLLTSHREWLLELEQTWLMANEEIYQKTVTAFNIAREDKVTNFRRQVMACLAHVLREEQPHLTLKAIADAIDHDPKTLTRDVKQLPFHSDPRTPEDLVRRKEETQGVVEEVLAELDEYPDWFKYSGRAPRTVAAVASYRAVDEWTQREVGEIFDVTTVAIRDARKELRKRTTE